MRSPALIGTEHLGPSWYGLGRLMSLHLGKQQLVPRMGSGGIWSVFAPAQLVPASEPFGP